MKRKCKLPISQSVCTTVYKKIERPFYEIKLAIERESREFILENKKRFE